MQFLSCKKVCNCSLHIYYSLEGKEKVFNSFFFFSLLQNCLLLTMEQPLKLNLPRECVCYIPPTKGCFCLHNWWQKTWEFLFTKSLLVCYHLSPFLWRDIYNMVDLVQSLRFSRDTPRSRVIFITEIPRDLQENVLLLSEVLVNQ